MRAAIIMSLAEVQSAIRDALVRGDATAIAPALAGGADPVRRLAVHQRHYAASLTQALLNRFPATVWLVGSEAVTDAAASFIRERPPSKPCIAEYGDAFPLHLATHAADTALPYLSQFAQLEWHLGRLALATDRSPHTHALHLDWALDELIGLYLTDSAPNEFSLRQEDVWLEIRGMRGTLEMRRITREEFSRYAEPEPNGDIQ
jgi:hypothetical protein